MGVKLCPDSLSCGSPNCASSPAAMFWNRSHPDTMYGLSNEDCTCLETGEMKKNCVCASERKRERNRACERATSELNIYLLLQLFDMALQIPLTKIAFFLDKVS